MKDNAEITVHTEMTQFFSGMIIEREIMGSRGLVPLQGVLKGGGAAPFFSYSARNRNALYGSTRSGTRAVVSVDSP